MTTQFPLYMLSHITYALLLIYMDRFLTDLWNDDKIECPEGIEECENMGSINIKDSGSS
jgi:hypothetical protein